MKVKIKILNKYFFNYNVKNKLNIINMIFILLNYFIKLLLLLLFLKKL